MNVAGWARKPLVMYNEQNIKADKKRIKKWKHYLVFLIGDGEHGLKLINGYGQQVVVVVKGRLLSFNLGYGFGDNHKATENGILYDGKVHKLVTVMWHYDINNYMKPWIFKSNDKRLELTLKPVYLLHSDITLKEMFNFLK